MALTTNTPQREGGKYAAALLRCIFDTCLAINQLAAGRLPSRSSIMPKKGFTRKTTRLP